MRRLIVLVAILGGVLVVEEATHGWVLGRGPLAPVCEAIGGKSTVGRCYSRLCYWIGDCGHWASPVHWWNRLKPGDPISKVIFWLGEPDRQEGEALLWHCWKLGDSTCKAVIRDGHLVALERIEPPVIMQRLTTDVPLAK